MIDSDDRVTTAIALQPNLESAVSHEVSPRNFGGLRRRLAAYDAVRILLGLVLLTAAGLKGHQLATSPVAETGILTSRWFLIAVVELELAVGIWLLSGIYPASARYVSLALLGVFGAVSVLRGMNGDASCGCFGSVKLDPWLTASLDLGLGILLLEFSPQRRAEGLMRFDARAVAACFIVFASAIGIAAFTHRGHPTLSEDKEVGGASPTVMLSPGRWLGRRFPLLEYIDITDTISRGEWTVVLYHHDCGKCQTFIRSLFENAYDSEQQRVALIELPPHRQSRERPADRLASAVFGRLSAAKEWFVATPLIVRMKDAQVTETAWP